jgi:hypothetical protein
VRGSLRVKGRVRFDADGKVRRVIDRRAGRA